MRAAPAALPDATIRPWAPHDEWSLRQLICDFLEDTETDLRPTDRTAAHLVELGMRGAEAGDPCLVLQDAADHAIVGFTLWLGFPVPCDTKLSVCQAMGTYLTPWWRGKGWGTHMRRAAAVRAQQRGYGRIVATSYTTRDTHSLMVAGFRPSGRILWHDLSR